MTEYEDLMRRVTRHPSSFISQDLRRLQAEHNRRMTEYLAAIAAGDYYQGTPYRWYHRLADRYWHDPIARFRVWLADRICPFDRDPYSGGNI
ncbi:MAG TPA: hypothetical protein PKV98_18905 [Burkholderiaceae bacterium]|nr:hypothetical protein [Burkholderiaceae bacterium]